MKQSIAARLKAHNAAGGTMNDDVTDALYREAHRTPAGEEVDLETVERWAWETVNRKPRA